MMPTPTSTHTPHARRRMPGLRREDGRRSLWVRRLLGGLTAAVLAAGATAGGGAPAVAAEVPAPPVAFATQPDAPSQYQGQVSCSSGETPGATAMRDLLRRAYGRANDAGSWRACGQGGQSEHKEGRAYDWMNNVSDPTQKATADSFVAWLVGPDARGVAAGNARRLGVQYVIWNRQTWQSWTGSWKPYTGSSPHTDHVHISLSWDGAFKRTSWWTGSAVAQVDLGPCQLYVGELAAPYSGPNYRTCPTPVVRPQNATGSTMAGGQELRGGQQITSPGGRFRAVMQPDGNFVVYDGAAVLFHSHTWTSPGAHVIMQTDGNLVVYAVSGQVLWHTWTFGNPGSRLVLQDDGNLVVYRPDNRPLWNIQVSGPGLIKG